MVKVFQAEHGDFLALDDGKTIVFVDGGTAGSYAVVRAELLRIAASGRKVSAWILTHLHDDHYGGMVAAMKDKTIPAGLVLKFYYNSPAPSGLPASALARVEAGNVLQFGDIQLLILTPTVQALNEYKFQKSAAVSRDIVPVGPVGVGVKSDYGTPLLSFDAKFDDDDSITNKSSITFIALVGGKKYLLCADQHAGELLKGLRALGYSDRQRLQVEALKVAHHGSKHNTSVPLLELVQTERYVFSANGTNQYFFPTKECVARILRRRSRSASSAVNLVFNYGGVAAAIFKVENSAIYRALNFTVTEPVKGAVFVEI